MDHGHEQEAEGVDQDVALAAHHLLGGVIAPLPAAFRGLHRLAVDHRCRGARLAHAVASDYKLDVALSPDNYLPGAKVLMTVSLTDRGWPAVDGRVNVTVSSPGGATHQVTLFDDGTHDDQEAGGGIEGSS